MSGTLDRALIYDLERGSIRKFVASHTFVGRVLDYGCGKQPYRDLVERTARYYGYDRAGLPGGTGGDRGEREWLERPWDTVLCTQVIQYVPYPVAFVFLLRELLPEGGRLVITGPSSWHEEEVSSLWRFTRSGVRRLLEAARFTVERLEDRATLDIGGFPVSLGWGAVARA